MRSPPCEVSSRAWTYSVHVARHPERSQMQSAANTSSTDGLLHIDFENIPGATLRMKWGPGWLAIVGASSPPVDPSRRWEWLRVHLQPAGPAPNQFQVFDGQSLA